MVTVKELIEILQKVEDKERFVVCASDPEGNSFLPLSSAIGECQAINLGYEFDIIEVDDDEPLIDKDGHINVLVIGP